MSPLDSQHKGPMIQNFDGFFVVSFDKLLDKHLSDQWNEMLMWCHSNKKE